MFFRFAVKAVDIGSGVRAILTSGLNRRVFNLLWKSEPFG